MEREEWPECDSCSSIAMTAGKCFQCAEVEKELSELLGCNISIVKPCKEEE